MEEMTLRETEEQVFTENTGEEAAEPAEEMTEETAGSAGLLSEEEDFTEEELAAWEAFREAYPEITPENIPEDVFRLMREGDTPVQAMRQVEIAGLKAENRVLKQRLAAAETERRNRMRTPGSMLGRAAAREDSFLAGLEM